jgi:L-arabinokinase
VKIYIAATAHGLGHITRLVPVLGALRELDPSVEIILSSPVTKEWLQAQLGFAPTMVQRAYEIGVAQHNCFETDIDRTFAGYREYARLHDERLVAERHFLKQQEVGGVVVDIPSLPVAAAADLELPVVAVSNFTWDWILEELLGDLATGEVEILRKDYSRGGLHLQLPFSPGTSPFPHVECAPLLARRAKMTSREVHGQLGLADDGRPLVVVSPGGWTATDWPLIEVESNADYQFLMVGDLPVNAARARHLPQDLPDGLTMVDLINAADVVIAKPGYGIASECLCHRTPLVAIERKGLPESPFLLDEFAAAGQLARLSLGEFFAGKWDTVIDEALSGDANWLDVPERPDLVIAQRTLENFNP